MYARPDQSIMREVPSDGRTKPCKCAIHKQNLMASSKASGNPPKPKSNSSWGSQIVKGFTTEKKSKLQTSNPSKKLPLACSYISSEKSMYVPYQSRVKRSLASDFPCSPNASQVHPHLYDCGGMRSPASRDLFLELDHLRSLLRDSKDRELSLHHELLRCKENQRVSELERELDKKKTEVEALTSRVGSLEAEKTNLSEQVASLSSTLERQLKLKTEDIENQTSDPSAERKTSYTNTEMEVLELRRLNKDLQLQKRNLAFRLSSTESQLAALTKITENDIVAKVQAEASLLRHTNEDLSKQVEGLQMSRLTEVEELAYLRWVNSCLRHELCNSDNLSMKIVDSGNDSIGKCNNTDNAGYGTSDRKFPRCTSNSDTSEIYTPKKVGHVKKLMEWPPTNEACRAFNRQTLLDKDWVETGEGISPRRRHSISGPKGSLLDLNLNKGRGYHGFICPKERENEASTNGNFNTVKDKIEVLAQKYDLGVIRSPRFSLSKHEPCKVATLDVEKRALRIPNPPPRPSTSVPVAAKPSESVPVPPPLPPPPPPPPKFSTRSAGVMKRAPQVAELYHSLMKRDSRKESSGGGILDVPNVANVQSSMIGEIENRSSHLLAIKADIETQGEFVNSLIKEVNTASFQDIEDVVEFVKWLDDELCFLVDERAVLKHFTWPEKKADTLREAAFEYRDLKKLESEVTNYEDDARLPCDVALKKLVALSEKMERSVYNLLRARDVMIPHCKDFQIPTDWMLDNGPISKIKFASVKLAMKYMKRVAMELQAKGGLDKDPALEYMLLQGVRFAFRVHQFAGGFDAETMQAFEELRNLAHLKE